MISQSVEVELALQGLTAEGYDAVVRVDNAVRVGSVGGGSVVVDVAYRQEGRVVGARAYVAGISRGIGVAVGLAEVVNEWAVVLGVLDCIAVAVAGGVEAPPIRGDLVSHVAAPAHPAGRDVGGFDRGILLLAEDGLDPDALVRLDREHCRGPA